MEIYSGHFKPSSNKLVVGLSCLALSNRQSAITITININNGQND